MILFLIALVIGIVCTGCHQRHKKINEKTRNWPQPPFWPLVGHMHHILRIAIGNQFKSSRELLSRYGCDHRIKLWFGAKLYLFTCNPLDMQTLLSTPELLSKPVEYDVFKNWLQDGLLISPVKKWSVRRKLLNPVFRYGMLKEFVKVFELHSRNMVKNLRHSAKQSLTVNIFAMASTCTLDIVCETALGVTVDAQSNKNLAYVTAVHDIHKILKLRISNVFYRYKIIYDRTRLAEKEKRLLIVIHDFSDRIIRLRRQQLVDNESENSSNETETDFSTRRKLTFLDTLLQATVNGVPLTDNEIREEVDTIIFGGFDTTATAISFLIYNFVKHNEWQHKCRQEVFEICGKDRTVQISFEQLRQLEYLDMCIKETLRLYPPVPFVGRKATTDCNINGYSIPAGSNILIAPIYTGRCEQFFPNAKSFQPNRFAKDAQVDPNTFLPFMLGPRSCLGQKFALLMVKMIAAQLLRNYIFESTENNQIADSMINFVITLQTRKPLLFIVKEL